MGLFWCNDAHRAARTFAWRRPCTEPASKRVQTGRWCFRVAEVGGCFGCPQPPTLLRGVQRSFLIERAMRCTLACAHLSGGPQELQNGPRIAIWRSGVRAHCTRKVAHYGRGVRVRHCTVLADRCRWFRYVCSLEVNSNS